MAGVLLIRVHHEKADYRHRHHDSGPTCACTTPRQMHIVSVSFFFFFGYFFSSVCIYLLMVKRDPFSITHSVFLDMMNAPSPGSCAHQVAARYQPLNMFQFLCYLPEVPT
jgi:hypothetical protein